MEVPSGPSPWWAVAVAGVPGLAALVAGYIEKRSARRINADNVAAARDARGEDYDLKIRSIVSAEQAALLTDMREECDRRFTRIRVLEGEVQSAEAEADRMRELARWWYEAAMIVRSSAIQEARRAGLLEGSANFRVSQIPKLPYWDDKMDPNSVNLDVPARSPSDT